MENSVISYQTASWRRSIVASPWRSIYVAVALMINALVGFAMLNFHKNYQHDSKIAAFVAPFLITVSFLMIWAAYQMYLVYQNTRSLLRVNQVGTHAQLSLSVSYIAYRLYLGLLAAIFLFLNAANISRS